MKELSGLAYVVSSDLKHGKLASQQVKTRIFCEGRSDFKLKKNIQVPRHMRRRAVSHDVRRLPRRLRCLSIFYEILYFKVFSVIHLKPYF